MPRLSNRFAYKKICEEVFYKSRRVPGKNIVRNLPFTFCCVYGSFPSLCELEGFGTAHREDTDIQRSRRIKVGRYILLSVLWIPQIKCFTLKLKHRRTCNIFLKFERWKYFNTICSKKNTLPILKKKHFRNISFQRKSSSCFMFYRISLISDMQLDTDLNLFE